MESLDTRYGFDVAFVDKPPELYRCIVCQLVLRNPVLIMKCGHRFCSPCLERYKEYSKQIRSELRCPVDRDLIDPTKVCDDHGLRRAVGSLVVKCGEWERGCSWVGELTELEHHQNSCQYQPCQNTIVATQEMKDLVAVVNGLQGKLETLNRKFEEKEKEIAHVNFRLQEMEERCNVNSKEIEFLKKKYNESETEVVMLQKRNDVLNEKNMMFEQEMAELKNSYDEKFRSSEDEMLVLKEKNDALKREVDLFKEKEAAFTQGLRELKLRYEEKPKSLQFSPAMSNARGTELHKEHVQMMKGESSVVPKKVLLTPLIGYPRITEDFHVIQSAGCYIVLAVDGAVPIGEKGFYEVTFKGGLGCRIGWVTRNYITLGTKSHMGECPNSYGYNAKYMKRVHNRREDAWGFEVAPDSGSVLGVAIDMQRGEILYGVDGNWQVPMGVAFDNINKDELHFPGISGYCAGEIFVNFGQVDFKFGPPHQSFKKLTAL